MTIQLKELAGAVCLVIVALFCAYLVHVALIGGV